ncbi:MAG: class I poly(R)-hydroxyalkanoic acid synthase [Xanthobacteraceae bacterium]|nr:MAG: class I poly(R)-hydroxyalkanoic acid synthase [Xanthobacteraceae bacterium]
MNKMIGTPDPEAANFNPQQFAANIARVMEEGGKALAAYLKPREDGSPQPGASADVIAEMVKTLAVIFEYWMSDPARAMELQTRLGQSFLELWGHAARRMMGDAGKPVIEPERRDRRFKDPQWTESPFFDFLKQAYLLTAQWAQELVANAEGVDPHTRHKAEFYIQQIVNAFSPSNFLLTNPEVLRETVTTNADNLVRGMKLLAEDVEAGGGTLRIRQTDTSKLEVGRDIATTPGKVVFQNELIQLIQYEPATETVLRTPLLIVPPWINKFYILDLKSDKSFIKFCVDNGLTVFVVSWVNPDEKLAHKTFEDYMKEGILAAMDAVEQATGEMRMHTIGYCVGGTLMASTLAWLAGTRRVRVSSTTFFAAQVDFTYAGDLMVFIDDDQLNSLDRTMNETGYLEGSKMATAFNLLRSNDLIWPYVINNYMKGQMPSAFDLLYWNADSTRMTSANHSYYLRNYYLENRLTKGTMVMDNVRLDLSKVKVPVYMLAAREDHIAPAKSVFLGSQFFGGPMRFVLSGSGHIAGVVNPPCANKYQYWTNEHSNARTLDAWLEKATEHPGSWWPDWAAWLRDIDPEEVPARRVGTGALPAIEDAPGSYVKVRS